MFVEDMATIYGCIRGCVYYESLGYKNSKSSNVLPTMQRDGIFGRVRIGYAVQT